MFPFHNHPHNGFAIVSFFKKSQIQYLCSLNYYRILAKQISRWVCLFFSLTAFLILRSQTQLGTGPGDSCFTQIILSLYTVFLLGQVQGAQLPVTICLRVWGPFSNSSKARSHYNVLLFKNNFQCLHFHRQASLPRLSALTPHSPLTDYFCCTGPVSLPPAEFTLDFMASYIVPVPWKAHPVSHTNPTHRKPFLGSKTLIDILLL